MLRQPDACRQACSHPAGVPGAEGAEVPPHEGANIRTVGGQLTEAALGDGGAEASLRLSSSSSSSRSRWVGMQTSRWP